MSRPVKGTLFTIAILILAITGVFMWHSPNEPFPPGTAGDDQTNPNIAEAQQTPEELRLNARELGANELGLVPILVYHLIGEKEGRWTRTPDNFRQDLRELYERGYVLVPLNDYLSGDMDVPAGKSPAVITLDDSTSGHFRLLEQNGELVVDPDSAVGILKAFGEEHPGFGHAATFFINAEPFGQRQYWQQKLQLLNEWALRSVTILIVISI